MKKIIIHLSDLHFRQNWEEDQGFVLDAFFKDLHKQVERTIVSNVYIAFSGDVVLAGSEPELYMDFFNQFEAELSRLKIPKIQRIFVPGNHDVSDEFIESNAVEHEGIVIQNLKEKDFNDYIQKTKPNILKDKFTLYKKLPDDLLIEFTGNYYAETKELIANSKVAHLIKINSQIEHKEAIKSLMNCNALLLFIASYKGHGVLTGKLFEYLASGTPVICIGPVDGDAAGVLQNTECGYAFGFNDEKHLKKQIEIAYENFKKGELTSKCINVDQFERKKLTKKIVDVFDQITA